MNFKTRKLLVPALLGFLLPSLAAADLANRIDAILARPANRKAAFAVHIVEASTGRTAYDHDARELMIPASNMKLITTAAALHYLGADFEYKTKVGLRGNTIVVIGSGDPILGDEVIDAKHNRKTGWLFTDIVQALKQKGIAVVKDIVVDSSIFDDERVHPNWPADQLNRWYAAEVSGLNYNDNCVNIIAKNVAGRIEIAVEPRTTFLELVNEIKPISQGDNAIGAYRNLHPNKLTLWGKCRTQATIADLAIERPPAFFGFLLAEHLARQGIKVNGSFIEGAFADRLDFKPLAEYTTPISDCLERSNKRSLGLVAEALLKTIAAHNSPQRINGSWKEGREFIGGFLSDLGLDKSQYYIDDGSGLSRINELTPHAITTVLLHLYKGRKWEMYKDSLAVGGVDGTIAKFFRQKKYKGRVIGKTGYIAGVRALSGLCITGKGDYIFSILVNNANGLSKVSVHDIAMAIVDDAEPEAPKPKPRPKPAEKLEPNEPVASPASSKGPTTTAEPNSG